ncbi:MAG: glycosyltransferase family 2 protein [Chloroflexi bacterium]|nr:glycosyltransferase family 2 protein [Chloroflexota bacterium]
MLDVAVIIVSWNTRNLLADCLRSLCVEDMRSGLDVGIWVVDNASTDGTTELVADLFPHVHLITNDHNPGFGVANNQGMQAAAAADPRYFFLLNSDTAVREGALTHLVKALDERSQAGMAGARLAYGDGRFQHSAFEFPRIGQIAFDLFPMPARLYESRWNGRYSRRAYRHNGKPFPVDFVLGAAMLVRADAALATDGFDEAFHMYCEEIDWGWRIRQAGWEIVVVPAAEIVHYGGASTSQIRAQSLINLWQSRAQFYGKVYGRFINRIAAKLVVLGMKRKQKQELNPELKQAYEKIIAIWQKK